MNRANYSFALCTSAHACDMECILRILDVTKKLLQPFSLSPIAETFHAHLSRSTQRQQQHVVHQPTVCSHCTSEIAFLLAPPTRTTHKDGCLNCCGTAAVTPLNYNISLQVCDAVKKISCTKDWQFARPGGEEEVSWLYIHNILAECLSPWEGRFKNIHELI